MCSIASLSINLHLLTIVLNYLIHQITSWLPSSIIFSIFSVGPDFSPTKVKNSILSNDNSLTNRVIS
ncbi:hypothetical protein A0H76_3000 [Hepatospora eriocheir]|uniref:Uncharacterized protein n=1 Tax=Hepatospora eriocheir TaxID=1081669 RepID=A0A1X0Q5L2_9MICR|nr:hypothetical protein A0H76_3000 [Hepatospora eriocheir]